MDDPTRVVESGPPSRDDEAATKAVVKRGEVTVRQKILIAAAHLRRRQGRDEDDLKLTRLAVRCWELFPESFALEDFEDVHPDSNRLTAKFSGEDGVCGLGWFVHTVARTYRITSKGLRVLKELLRAYPVLAKLLDTDVKEKCPVVNDGVIKPILAAMLTSAATDVTTAPSPLPAPAPVRLAAAREEPRRRPAADAPPPKPAPAKAAPAPASSGGGRHLVAVPGPTASSAAVTASTLNPLDVNELQQLGKADALRKFLRGVPLSFADACQFWGFTSASRPAVVVQRLDASTDLLKRAVESFSGGVDARIPPLSTCYGLFNLNRLMAEKFARELEGLKTPRP